MDRRTRMGVGLTFIWVLVVAVISLLRIKELIGLSLNNIGDFLAGSFSPIALLWLVIGYFQQGDELKLNTAALALQADELNHLVNETKESNATRTRQADLMERSFNETAAAERVAAQLDFRMKDYTSTTTDSAPGLRQFKLNLINNGPTVTETNYCASHPDGTQERQRIGLIGHDNVATFSFNLPQNYSGVSSLHFEYVDGSGRVGEHQLYLTFDQEIVAISKFAP